VPADRVCLLEVLPMCLSQPSPLPGSGSTLLPDHVSPIRIGVLYVHPSCTRAGVLTETSAELAAALTLAAARRVVEGDAFMRAGRFQGTVPTLFVGKLLQARAFFSSLYCEAWVMRSGEAKYRFA